MQGQASTSAKAKTLEGEALRIHQMKESQRLNTTPSTVWPLAAPAQQRLSRSVLPRQATATQPQSSEKPYKTIPGSDFFVTSPSNSPSTPKRRDINLQELEFSDAFPDFNARIHGMVGRLRKGTDTWKSINRRTRTKVRSAERKGASRVGEATQQLKSSSLAHHEMRPSSNVVEVLELDAKKGGSVLSLSSSFDVVTFYPVYRTHRRVSPLRDYVPCIIDRAFRREPRCPLESRCLFCVFHTPHSPTLSIGTSSLLRQRRLK